MAVIVPPVRAAPKPGEPIKLIWGDYGTDGKGGTDGTVSVCSV